MPTLVTRPLPKPVFAATNIVPRAVVAVPPVVFPTKPAAETPPVQPSPVAPAVNGFPRPVINPFEAQVALARQAISSGSIDGAIGFQTRLAVRQFQLKNHLPVTGALDHATKAALLLDAPPLTTYTVTTNDLARLQPLGKTWLEKSQQSALDYETELELVTSGDEIMELARLLKPGRDTYAAADVVRYLLSQTK